jgi:hypothetical protein
LILTRNTEGRQASGPEKLRELHVVRLFVKWRERAK